MRLTTVADADAAAARAAELIARLLEAAVRERGVAHLSLAGGSTPRVAYERLGPALADWGPVALWFGDERCVPAEDAESNFRMVSESLLSAAPIATEQVHRIPGELGPDPAAEAYEEELRAHVALDADSLPVLDVALLGLGEDGHTASLFPGRPALEVSGRACVGVHDAPKPPPARVTLTLEVFRRARRCVLLATGSSKADAVAAVLAGPDRHVPASLLRDARLEMIVDDAAAPSRTGA